LIFDLKTGIRIERGMINPPIHYDPMVLSYGQAQDTVTVQQ